MEERAWRTRHPSCSHIQSCGWDQPHGSGLRARKAEKEVFLYPGALGETGLGKHLASSQTHFPLCKSSLDLSIELQPLHSAASMASSCTRIPQKCFTLAVSPKLTMHSENPSSLRAHTSVSGRLEQSARTTESLTSSPLSVPLSARHHICPFYLLSVFRAVPAQATVPFPSVVTVHMCQSETSVFLLRSSRGGTLGSWISSSAGGPTWKALGTPGRSSGLV